MKTCLISGQHWGWALLDMTGAEPLTGRFLHRLTEGGKVLSDDDERIVLAVRRGDCLEWFGSDGCTPIATSPVPDCDCWRTHCVSCGRPRVLVDRDPESFVTRARVPSGPFDDCPECKLKGPSERLADATSTLTSDKP